MVTTTVKLELDAGHAWALALFLKRVGWSDIRGNAQDDTEAYDIRDAVEAAARALADAGYAPR